MSEGKRLLSLNKNKNDIRNEILKNIIKMLTNRQLLKEEEEDKNIDKLKKSKNENDEYHIVLNDKNKFIIKFLMNKLTTINKSSGILEFLDMNFENHFLLVVPEISSKTQKELQTKYKKSEVFMEHELLIDLMSHVLVPKQYKLNVDTEKFLAERNSTKKNFPSIRLNDPIARYLNLKEGDIIRIVRPSETSGQTVSYRIATRGKMNKQ